MLKRETAYMLILVLFSIGIGVAFIIGYDFLFGSIAVISLLTLFIIRPKLFIFTLVSLLTMHGLITGGERFASDSLLNFDVRGLINILAVLLGAAYFLFNRKARFFGATAKLYLVFLFFCALSLLYSKNFYEGIRFLARLASPFVFYLIILNEIKIERDIKTLIKCIFISAVVPLTLGMYQLITGSGNHYTRGFMRIYATYGHPNAYSFYLVFLFCITYTYLLSRDYKWKPWMVLLNILIVFSILQTYCRIAWVALAIVFFFLNYRYGQKKIIIISLILGLPISIYLMPSIIKRFKDVIQLLTGHNLLRSDISLGWRFNAWNNTLKRVPEHLFIGHGLGSAPQLMLKLYRQKTTPHNGYLRILYDTGLIGLSLFVSVIFAMAIRGNELLGKIKKGYEFDSASMYMSCLIAFVFILISDNILEYYSVAAYFWVLFAVGGNISRELKINKIYE